MNSEPISLFDSEPGTLNSQPGTRNPQPVTCLGMEFPTDEERRNHFTDLLRQKLKDPEFRKIEGFPIGEDEDILALSDPPYYTACPNPWVGDFIKEWEAEKGKRVQGSEPGTHEPGTLNQPPYQREPYAADVSEGKNDPIYNAHSYHTKVPHKAIMRYILHYTNPGDIVFDGFCGTGMTGVAAQMCGDRDVVKSLGYQVLDDGTILSEEVDEDGKNKWVPFSKLGVRRAALNDLSPAATFIAYNYNTPVNVTDFEREAKKILKEVEAECGWMYETKHTDGRIGKINFTVWSDVFICPECSKEVIFWEAAVDKVVGIVNDEFKCPNCSVRLTKRNIERSWASNYEHTLNDTIRQVKQVPVLINYTVAGKRFEKKPDTSDIALIKKIENSQTEYWFPNCRMPIGQETRRNDPIGSTHVHHFYSRRNLFSMAMLRDLIFKRRSKTPQLGMWFTSSHVWGTRLNRLLVSNYFQKRGGVIGQTLQGTLYISSVGIETNVLERFRLRINSVPHTVRSISGAIETRSSSRVNVPDSSVDYIFIDPPFGSNLMYSELNFLWEKWLSATTNIREEAIESSIQSKGIDEYRILMMKCFKEAYRIIKPGRWMTVEFSNTKASVWNNIQTALVDAGFVVANVSALEKSHKGYRAVTTPTAVRQDLVISAYKPNGGFEERFKTEANTDEGVWDFISTHLKYLPAIKHQGNDFVGVPERDARILFDQMISYYVRNGYSVPIDSHEFQNGLAQRFSERDGMYFLPEQAAEYDRKKVHAVTALGLQQEIFVDDESSAIEWLRNILKSKPQTFQDINPDFMQKIGGWKKTEIGLELSTLLHENFLCYEGVGPVPEQIHAYLSTNWKDMRKLPKDDPTLVAKADNRWYVPDPNKAGDIEKLRERALLREFDDYKDSKKKLKVFRLEAVRAGFKKSWQDRDYATIISVAEKIPGAVLEEDPKLLMWYDQAVTRKGVE
jgi:rubredoxin